MTTREKEGWIFVLRDEVLYAGPKTSTPPRFHHTSLLAGEACTAAGILHATRGRLHTLLPHSGHYRPTDHDVYKLLAFMHAAGVPLGTVRFDCQRLLKVARARDAAGKKRRKLDSTTWDSAAWAYDFLRHRHAAAALDTRPRPQLHAPCGAAGVVARRKWRPPRARAKRMVWAMRTRCSNARRRRTPRRRRETAATALRRSKRAQGPRLSSA